MHSKLRLRGTSLSRGPTHDTELPTAPHHSYRQLQLSLSLFSAVSLHCFQHRPVSSHTPPSPTWLSHPSAVNQQVTASQHEPFPFPSPSASSAPSTHSLQPRPPGPSREARVGLQTRRDPDRHTDGGAVLAHSHTAPSRTAISGTTPSPSQLRPPLPRTSSPLEAPPTFDIQQLHSRTTFPRTHPFPSRSRLHAAAALVYAAPRGGPSCHTAPEARGGDRAEGSRCSQRTARNAAARSATRSSRGSRWERHYCRSFSSLTLERTGRDVMSHRPRAPPTAPRVHRAPRARPRCLAHAHSAPWLQDGRRGARRFRHDISEIGRSAKSYCEHTARTQPTLSDIVVTLVEMGFNVETLPAYAKRSQRMVITARM
uniref:TATA-box binding protein associated factor 8 n=1 Tax=Meleagris gallopavo TaxID=9103 RepID=A0A803YMS2_MELGA